jgi:hypothetical protein
MRKRGALDRYAVSAEEEPAVTLTSISVVVLSPKESKICAAHVSANCFESDPMGSKKDPYVS